MLAIHSIDELLKLADKNQTVKFTEDVEFHCDIGDLLNQINVNIQTTGSLNFLKSVNVIRLQAGQDISAGRDIKAGWNISAGGSISAGENISAGGSISAGENISAGRDIKAGWNISAGGFISAGWNISAGGFISAGGSISVVVSISAGGFISAGGSISVVVSISAKNVNSKYGTVKQNTNQKENESQPMKKKFVCFNSKYHGNYTIIACVDENNNVCPFKNEKLPNSWPINWKIQSFEEIDISYEAYLKINNIKLKTKEEEISELESKIIEHLGCQKEHLSPILKTFITLLKQIKESKSSHNEVAVQVMSSVLTNNSVAFANNAFEISKLLKQIKEII